MSYPQLKNRYISIAGLIGAGKTTLANDLARVVGLPAHLEEVAENPYLEDFYKDMARYGFALQMHLLCTRTEQQVSILNSCQGAVQDRTLYEDRIFAKVLHDDGLMETREYTTYLRHLKLAEAILSTPDLIVYLQITPEKSLERIKSRGRGCETNVTLEYLQKLHGVYEEVITEISEHTTVLRLQWQEFKSVDHVATLINEVLEKRLSDHASKEGVYPSTHPRDAGVA